MIDENHLWTTGYGRVVALKDLGTEHLVNLYHYLHKYIERNQNLHTREEFVNRDLKICTVLERLHEERGHGDIPAERVFNRFPPRRPRRLSLEDQYFEAHPIGR